jgi:hypothetical protein
MVGGIVAMALITSISAKQIFMRNKFWNYSVPIILAKIELLTQKIQLFILAKNRATTYRRFLTLVRFSVKLAQSQAFLWPIGSALYVHNVFLNFEEILLGWLSLRVLSQDDALRRADLLHLNGSPFLGFGQLLSFYFLQFPNSRL